MIKNFLVRLGVRFEDPAMEKANDEYRKKIQSRIFVAFSLLCTAGAVLQVTVDYVYRVNDPLIDLIVAGCAFLALLVRNRIPWFYKLCFMMYIPYNNYMTIRHTVYRSTPQPAGVSCLVGNYLGIIEILFMYSFRQASLQIFLECVYFLTKLAALGKELSFNDTFFWSCFIFVICCPMLVYNDALERRSFRMVYESKQTLEKFQALLSNDFPSNVAIVDSEFTSILYSNQAFTQKFSSERLLDKKELISFIFRQFYIETLVKPLSYQHLISKGCNLLDFARNLSSSSFETQSDEVIILSATYGINEENLQHFEIRLRKILWEGKGCYAVILNDFSDKQLVTALKYADEQKDRVIATVSHELRTPINGILGLLEMAEPQVTDETAQTYLKHCKSCSKLLLYLVNSILDLSQIRHNKLHIVKDTFNLDELLEEMKSLYQFQCQQKGIELIIQRGMLVPDFIYNDKYRVIEILINLLSNAFKFTFKGSITLSVMKDNATSKKLKFCVQDTGLGIKDEDKSKLFQMFGKITQQNKNVNAHGVGLGLTISNNLVKALNNQEEEALELESEYEKGSIFSFRIPFRRSTKSLFLTIQDDVDVDMNMSQIPSDEASDLQEFSPRESPIQTKMEILTSRGLLSHTQQSEDRFTRMRGGRSPVLRSNILSSTLPQNFSNREIIQSDDRIYGLSQVSPNTAPPILARKIGRKVLVVDDNPFNLLTASFLLEKQGLTVVKATSGEHCIDLLTKSCENKTSFDLVFMDIQMPIQDGIETTKIIVSKIKSGELYDVPVVALTANKVMAQEVKVYKESGMREAIEKPLREDILKRVLNTYLSASEQRLIMNNS